MLDRGSDYPSYISQMISELRTSDSANNILQKYMHFTDSDYFLASIYKSLSYSPQSRRALANEEVISMILKDYITDLPDISSNWEIQNGLRDGFMRTYYDNHINLISSPNDIGLDIYPQSPNELFEESSLTTMWGETTPSTNKKIELLCTPPSTTLRSRNGLKALSWRVKEIVERYGSATYKDVADELLQELQTIQGEEDFKDEKNVRRRVYDALNVLIAAEILQKRGKQVESKIRSTFRTSFKLENSSDTYTAKRKMLKKLSQNYIAIKNLIERNKNLERNQDKLKLPVFLVAVGTSSNEGVRSI